VERKGTLESLLVKLKQDSEYLNFGREIITKQVAAYCAKVAAGELRILDIGVGDGQDIENIRPHLKGKKAVFAGVECYRPFINVASHKGIEIFPINVEREPIPLPDQSCDIVIANQIIEHTKEIFWIFGELSRVLKKEGILIVGMPNLSSLHNRILLLFGQQPTCIKPLSEHVRGFTRPGFERFISCGGYFKLTRYFGANFYPFPPWLSRGLSRWLPTFSTALIYVVTRTGKDGNFISILDSGYQLTPYFKG
jgi:ubiquinone/menaquinone biosynthesis C-methylase UbiE